MRPYHVFPRQLGHTAGRGVSRHTVFDVKRGAGACPQPREEARRGVVVGADHAGDEVCRAALVEGVVVLAAVVRCQEVIYPRQGAVLARGQVFVYELSARDEGRRGRNTRRGARDVYHGAAVSKPCVGMAGNNTYQVSCRAAVRKACLGWKKKLPSTWQLLVGWRSTPN